MNHDAMLRLTPEHLRVSRSCVDAAKLLLQAMPADNTLRPVQASERVYRGKRPVKETIRVSLHVAGRELNVRFVTATIDGVLYVAKVDPDFSMRQLAEKFEERDAAYPGYAPLELVSTFETI